MVVENHGGVLSTPIFLRRAGGGEFCMAHKASPSGWHNWQADSMCWRAIIRALATPPRPIRSKTCPLSRSSTLICWKASLLMRICGVKGRTMEEAAVVAPRSTRQVGCDEAARQLSGARRTPALAHLQYTQRCRGCVPHERPAPHPCFKFHKI